MSYYSDSEDTNSTNSIIDYDSDSIKKENIKKSGTKQKYNKHERLDTNEYLDINEDDNGENDEKEQEDENDDDDDNVHDDDDNEENDDDDNEENDDDTSINYDDDNDENDDDENDENDDDENDDDEEKNNKYSKKQKGGKDKKFKKKKIIPSPDIIKYKLSADDKDNDDDDDDDDDKDGTNYLKKFDNEITQNYIINFHHECIKQNYDEILILAKVIRNKDNIIIDDLHKTIPYLTKYERTRILGQRAKQINSGAIPFVKVPENVIEGYLIAEMELKEKLIPFIIRRPLPNGSSEYWHLRDLENISF